MRFLGFLFVAVVISSFLVWLSLYIGNTHLDSFLDSQLIPTLATIVGFSVAAVIFILGQLSTVEIQTGKSGHFKSTKKELRHNIYTLLFIFFIAFILFIFKPSLDDISVMRYKILYYSISIASLTIFIISLVAIYEVIGSS